MHYGNDARKWVIVTYKWVYFGFCFTASISISMSYKSYKFLLSFIVFLRKLRILVFNDASTISAAPYLSSSLSHIFAYASEGFPIFDVLMFCANFDGSGPNQLASRSYSSSLHTFNSDVIALEEVFKRG